MSQPPNLDKKHPLLERILEQLLFASRWMLAPIYLGLAASLILLLISFARKAAVLVAKCLTAGSDEMIIGILSLIDLSLMGNLVLIVMFAGYQNFVSHLDLDGHRDKPDWVDHVDFGDLKLKLMASIIAISAIHMLEDFMHLDQMSDRELIWGVGLNMAFVVSGLLLALMDRISPSGHR